MDRNKTMIKRWLIPSGSAALLVAMLMIGGVSLRRPSGLEGYFEHVRDVVTAIPRRIGQWNGLPADSVSPQARDLLKPNIILQRRYTNLDTNKTVSLLVVHCGNVRDMEGHYPLNCYPNQGWVTGKLADRVIETDRLAIPARDYPFTLPPAPESLEVPRPLRVTGFFVMPTPDEPVYREIKALEAASRSPTATGLGSAQIQILSSDAFSEQEWDTILRDFGEALADAIETIGGGVHAS
jgi:hypothetical protein